MFYLRSRLRDGPVAYAPDHRDHEYSSMRRLVLKFVQLSALGGQSGPSILLPVFEQFLEEGSKFRFPVNYLCEISGSREPLAFPEELAYCSNLF